MSADEDAGGLHDSTLSGSARGEKKDTVSDRVESVQLRQGIVRAGFNNNVRATYSANTVSTNADYRTWHYPYISTSAINNRGVFGPSYYPVGWAEHESKQYVVVPPRTATGEEMARPIPRMTPIIGTAVANPIIRPLRKSLLRRIYLWVTHLYYPEEYKRAK